MILIDRISDERKEILKKRASFNVCNFSNMLLTDDELGYILTLIKDKKNAVSLILNNNNLTCVSFGYLNEFFLNNDTVVRLDVRNNFFNSRSHYFQKIFNRFLDTLNKNRSLVSFKYNHEVFKPMSNAINDTLSLNRKLRVILASRIYFFTQKMLKGLNEISSIILNYASWDFKSVHPIILKVKNNLTYSDDGNVIAVKDIKKVSYESLALQEVKGIYSLQGIWNTSYSVRLKNSDSFVHYHKILEKHKDKKGTVKVF